MSPGFDPEHDLARIGLANQTTMLMSESLEIQEMLRAVMGARYGEELPERFRGPNERIDEPFPASTAVPQRSSPP